MITTFTLLFDKREFGYVKWAEKKKKTKLQIDHRREIKH